MSKKIPFAGQFDYSNNPKNRQRSFKIRAYDFKSASDMPVRPTGTYADNAMVDPSRLNESDDSQIDTLKALLNKAGVTDEEIKGGLSLTQVGYHKIAAALGVSIEQAQTLVTTLVKSLSVSQGAQVTEKSSKLIDEIDREINSMTFPWELGERHGTAKADYADANRGDGSFFFKVVSVRDDSEREIPKDEFDDSELRDIRQQGIDFIGRE